jgi:Flagellar hook-length control protein FliK
VSAADPLAAITARVVAAEAAMLEAAINLGAAAELLEAQINVGDVLAAKILPPQQGQDLIEILGRRVAAQLPPGIHPGETLLLEVTGFSATQVFVRNLGTPDPQNPVPVKDVLLSAVRSSEQQAATPGNQQLPAAKIPAVSPPRAVFVAASVQPAAPQTPQAHAETTQPQTAQPQPQPQPIVQGVEARIAAAQAAKAAPAVIPQRLTAPLPAPAHSAPVKNVPVQNVPVQNVVQRAVQTVSEFLRAARLPDTPLTRMAATIAPHAPERLPSVLQRLEAALPHTGSDARVSTLRTLIGFTARFNPANAETLPAQISSYVSNVVEGVEAKVAQLLQAHAQVSAPPQAQTPAPANQPQADSPALPPALAQARVAERAAAISHDLKSVVLSLLRQPPADRTPAMTQALSETLITLTGAQVNALSANQQAPGTFTLTLPVYYHEGGKPAQIRISPDAESRAAKMDADNFHIAFVLDTANLGTVAIDLQTTGRTVKVDVKTEHKAAAARFSDTLSSLRTRLEDLRYRVASAVAGALPARKTGHPTAAEMPAKKRGLDLRA